MLVLQLIDVHTSTIKCYRKPRENLIKFSQFEDTCTGTKNLSNNTVCVLYVCLSVCVVSSAYLRLAHSCFKLSSSSSPQT